MAGSAESFDSRYKILTHSEIGAAAPQVHGLAQLAFGTYPGVLRPSEAHRRWYIRRPGMDPNMSQAALYDGCLVSSVFVTVVKMRLCGSVRLVGIIDTVMTHPSHRRRGLARHLLSRAIADMRACGLAATMLYTMPDTVPFHLYRDLGFTPHAKVHCLSRTSAGESPSGLKARCAKPSDDQALMMLVDGSWRCFEGYVPVDGALWRWRKHDRPRELPAEIACIQEEGRLLGCVTICRAPIVGKEPDSTSYVLTDLALDADCDGETVLQALLGQVPAGEEIRILSAEGNWRINHLLLDAGFVRDGEETAMLLPLRPGATPSSNVSGVPWYVLTESVIGV